MIGRKKHSFPNLASMKLSGFYKSQENDVVLKTDYDDLHVYDKVFISKVFTDTPIDQNVLNLPNVEYGGTGFFYDAAVPLSYEIEHHMPDYHLYDEWVSKKLNGGGKRSSLKEYLDYSIGYLTRGCFRKCEFCVNKKYDRVVEHSPLEEFYDPKRKKICLLDDNFFGFTDWKQLLQELKDTGKPFVFKQGLDERILTEEKCQMLFSSRYDGDFFFAFDNIQDYDLVKRKLEMIRKFTDKRITFYVLVGFDRNNRYDHEFWRQDIFDAMKRIKLLMEYHCAPYIMRFNRYLESPYQGVYKTLAGWCNQPSMLKTKSLREYGIVAGINTARNKYIVEFEKEYPEFTKYMDMRWQ